MITMKKSWCQRGRLWVLWTFIFMIVSYSTQKSLKFKLWMRLENGLPLFIVNTLIRTLYSRSPNILNYNILKGRSVRTSFGTFSSVYKIVQVQNNSQSDNLIGWKWSKWGRHVIVLGQEDVRSFFSISSSHNWL